MFTKKTLAVYEQPIGSFLSSVMIPKAVTTVSDYRTVEQKTTVYWAPG